MSDTAKVREVLRELADDPSLEELPDHSLHILIDSDGLYFCQRVSQELLDDPSAQALLMETLLARRSEFRA